jgi:asparagine synthase (glutamine-hydrolysing)
VLVRIAENIKEFPPGQYFLSGSGFKKYYDLPSDPPSIKEPELAVKKLNVLLGTAVEKMIHAGRRIGIYISGGVDSSIIAALAKDYCENLKAFAVGMEKCDDLHFARLVANHLDMQYFEYVYDINDVLEILPKVIYFLESFDSPLVRGAVPNYLVAQLAKDEVDLVLIGEGADEDFGGYHKLKRLASHYEQHEAIRDLFKGLHHGECTRVDRMNTSNCLSVGAPFLDKDVVDFAFKLHPSIKIHGKEKIEKWILRKAFQNILPKSLIWRPKKQFAQGCGSYNLLIPYAESIISDETFDNERAMYPDIDIRWKEELLYFQIFRNYFGDEPSILKTVRRWYD